MFYIPPKSVTQVSPSPHTGHLVKDYCSYVHTFKAGFLFCKGLCSQNICFSNNHFHLFITDKFIYLWSSKKKTLPRVMGSHPMQGWFLWHSLVHIWMQMAADVIRCCILCEQPRKFHNYLISDSALDLSCSWLSHQVTIWS